MTDTLIPTVRQFTATQFFLVAFKSLAFCFAVCAIYFVILVATQEHSRRLVTTVDEPQRILDVLSAMPEAERSALTAREWLAVSANPLDITGLKNLAVLYFVSGDITKSNLLTVLASNRSLRDVSAQSAAFKILIDSKEYSEALYRLDGLIRAKPEKNTELMATAIAFGENAETMPFLIEVLAQNPPWRGNFLSLFCEKSFSENNVYRLFSAVNRTTSPITKIELRPFLRRLFQDGSYEKANYVWLDFLSTLELRRVATVFDGGFDLELGNLYFDWTFEPLKNVDLRIIPRAPGSTDRVLQIEFANGRSAFNQLTQILQLAPGNYLFSGEAKADQLQNEQGLVWRINCISPSDEMVMQSSPTRGTVGWAYSEKNFTVPQQNCRIQRLHLELSAKSELDQQISGRAYFDNIRIQKSEFNGVAQ